MDLNQRFNMQHSDWISESKKDTCSAKIFFDLEREISTNAHYYLEKGLKNNHLSDEVFEELYEKGSDEIVGYLAQNKYISNKLIDRMIKENKKVALYALAKRDDLDLKIINRLFKLAHETSNVFLVNYLIHNKMVDLDYLFEHYDEIHKHHHYKLGLDSCIEEDLKICDRQTLYSNLENLNKDDRFYIAASDNLNADSSILEYCYINAANLNVKNAIGIKVAKNPNIDSNLFLKLLNKGTLSICLALLENPKCGIDTLFILANRWYNEYNKIVPEIIKFLKHKDFGVEVYEELSYIDDKDFILFLANNVDRLDISNRSKRVLLKLCNSEYDEVRLILAKKCKDESILMALALINDDFNTYVNIINNKNTDDQTLYILSNSKKVKDLSLIGDKAASKAADKIIDFKYRYKINFLSKFNRSEKEEELVKSLRTKLKEIVPLTVNIKSDTSLIQASDKIVDSDGIIILKPDNINLITRNLDMNSVPKINYGSYPQKKVGNVVTGVLNALYDIKELVKTGQTYRIISNDGNILIFPEYVFNDRRFIRLNSGDKESWLEVSPVVWRAEKDGLILESKLPFMKSESYRVMSSDEKELYLNKYFMHDIYELYKISDEEKKIKAEEDKKKELALAKFKLIKKSDEEEKNNKEITEKIKEVMMHLQEVQKLLNSLEKQKITTAIINNQLLSSVSVPEDILIIKVDDHFEFNPDFIPFLKFIDLQFVKAKNLKLSGLDLSETNLRFNPQEIYNKDLRNSKLSDENVVWASFKDVDLRGSNVEQEKESYDFEYAITDDTTILPEKKKESKLVKQD